MKHLDDHEATADSRLAALTQTRETYAANPDFKDEPILGAIMETGHDDTVVSLVTFINGVTHLYFSVGGGVVGAEMEEQVKIAARRFTQFAGVHIPEMNPCEEFPLPKVGQTTFYALTRTGVHSLTTQERELIKCKHSFAPLFDCGHNVIEHLHQLSDGDR